ncbi:Prophage tail fibre N-terminal [Serratia fonticola]|uniref:phage tail fiber protein n=1 Tax=Serratia fonticola TaxID=47917 RepID=UPI002177894D|nr:prophage tail fiber N-terminal domain-containing protein [Serratia fonticola]CAI2028239.1 Prophage tail fibre N-terminal [Serratia fonticola]
MAVITGVLKGPMGDALEGVVIELRALRTSATVITQERSSSVTNATGRYTLTVEPGDYSVFISAFGRTPENRGSISVKLNSATGTLNDFLLIPGESDLNPDIVETVDRMRSDAAASAAAAKVSETNASAAMSNALSKVATAEQTVASPVKFNNGITSLSDAVMQAKTPGANVIMRFKDVDGVEKGAIFNTVASGQMTQRWGGTAFSAIYKEDGTVTFPSDVYSGNAKFATRAIALGTKDLNTVFEEGEHYQSTSANATPARNYPNYLAGVLRVLVSRASVGSGIYVTQQYYPYKASAYFFQRVYDAGIAAWTDWESFRSQSYNDTRYVALQGVGKTFSDLEAFKTWQSSQNGLTSFRLSAAVGGFPAYNPGLIWNTSDTYAMLMPYYSSSEIKCVTGNASGKYQEFFLWNTGNTTVDSNGFIKKASPIVKLFSDGTSELNDQSQGVTTEWVSEGVYRISGTLGFNADAEWGGVDGGIEIPTDRNKLPLVWVDYEVDATGDLLIKTFHRINSTAPKFAQNVKVGYKEGQPIDIPDGRWIDLRVEMPANDEPEYEPVPEDEEAPEVTPEVTDPEVGEEPALGEVPAPIEEHKE